MKKWNQVHCKMDGPGEYDIKKMSLTIKGKYWLISHIFIEIQNEGIASSKQWKTLSLNLKTNITKMWGWEKKTYG